MKLPRILVSAASSGSGKTIFTCALLHHLKTMGLNVAAFKCGPDYIDPMFHMSVSDVPCVNMDPFFLRGDRDAMIKLLEDYTRESYNTGKSKGASKHADIAVIEGVMGFYDGMNSKEDYSTYSVAAKTETPAIVIVDAKGSALTALAVAEGMAGFVIKDLNNANDSNNVYDINDANKENDANKVNNVNNINNYDLHKVNIKNRGNMIRGIIFNNMSDSVYSQVLEEYNRRKNADAGYASFEIFGHIRRMPKELTLESRHLGLITPDNVPEVREKIARIYECMKDTIEWDKLILTAHEANVLDKNNAIDKNNVLDKNNALDKNNVLDKNNISCKNNASDENDAAQNKSVSKKALLPVIAVARDNAFNFYYEENLRALREAGADIKYFSPLADEPVPADATGIYIGGGYPESYLDVLSSAAKARESIRMAAESGVPIIAECGGFMYLMNSIDGAPMCGIIPMECRFTGHLVRFGYVTLTAKHAGDVLSDGDSIRGHEFHYYEAYSDDLKNEQLGTEKERCGICEGSKIDDNYNKLTGCNVAEQTGCAEGSKIDDNYNKLTGCAKDKRLRYIYTARNLKGETYDGMLTYNNILAGFPHLYFPSCPGFAERFVKKCMGYSVNWL